MRIRKGQKIIMDHMGEKVVIGFINDNNELEYNSYKHDDGGCIGLGGLETEEELSFMAGIDIDESEIHVVEERNGT